MSISLLEMSNLNALGLISGEQPDKDTVFIRVGVGFSDGRYEGSR